MQVYKFGGASIATPERMKSLLSIIQESHQPLTIVVSAIGKSTNALEEIVSDACNGQIGIALEKLQVFEKMHFDYAEQILSKDKFIDINPQLDEYFTEIHWTLDDVGIQSNAYIYDQIVCIGEMLSSTIFHAFLRDQQIDSVFIDIRDILRTDDTYQNAKVDDNFTKQQVIQIILPLLKENKIIVTQGFIGCTSDNTSTTLGREGSDYTAALLGSMLSAKSVTIWKDVAGFLNADPRQFHPTQKIDEITYHEIIEMAYYGAQVIHPKTIKPLQNAQIPLYVKCFLDPKAPGTKIFNTQKKIHYPPLMILKHNQVLLQITSRDFSFITEENISKLYKIFHDHQLKINILQHAAISLVICITNIKEKVHQLITDLKEDYKVRRNEDLNLLTIRHYKEGMHAEIIKENEILLEQKTRTTIQVVYANRS